MDVKDILSRCDHTLLTQGATWAEIRALCDDGVKYGCASVCIQNDARYCVAHRHCIRRA